NRPTRIFDLIAIRVTLYERQSFAGEIRQIFCRDIASLSADEDELVLKVRLRIDEHALASLIPPQCRAALKLTSHERGSQPALIDDRGFCLDSDSFQRGMH